MREAAVTRMRMRLSGGWPLRLADVYVRRVWLGLAWLFTSSMFGSIWALTRSDLLNMMSTEGCVLSSGITVPVYSICLQDALNWPHDVLSCRDHISFALTANL